MHAVSVAGNEFELFEVLTENRYKAYCLTFRRQRVS